MISEQQRDIAVAALKPFAKLADDYDAAEAKTAAQYRDEGRPPPGPKSDGHRVSIALGEARAARNALTELEKAAPPPETQIRAQHKSDVETRRSFGWKDVDALLRLLDEVRADLQQTSEALRQEKAEIARLTAPPGASAMERARAALKEAGMVLNHNAEPICQGVARAIEQAEREAEKRGFAVGIEEASRGIPGIERKARAAALGEVKKMLGVGWWDHYKLEDLLRAAEVSR